MPFVPFMPMFGTFGMNGTVKLLVEYAEKQQVRESGANI